MVPGEAKERRGKRQRNWILESPNLNGSVSQFLMSSHLVLVTKQALQLAQAKMAIVGRRNAHCCTTQTGNIIIADVFKVRWITRLQAIAYAVRLHWAEQFLIFLYAVVFFKK